MEMFEHRERIKEILTEAVRDRVSDRQSLDGISYIKTKRNGV